MCTPWHTNAWQVGRTSRHRWRLEDSGRPISAIRGGSVIAEPKKTNVARGSGARVRVEFVAVPFAVLAALLFRAESFGTSMGPDELSLLIMARSMIDGAFPYEVYWDIRAPLAYVIALPSALLLPDAFAALAVLRVITVLVHAGAAWTFFCLFRRSLGVPGAVIGVVVLFVTANMVELHRLAMPNHFVMGVSLAAFACLIAGLRGRRACFLFSALLAGALPWVMVQSGLVTLGLTALVLSAGTSLHRRDRAIWVAIAACPSVLVVGAFFVWGPFDAFVRTVFLAPLGVIEAAVDGSWTMGDLPRSVPWLCLFIAVISLGALQFSGTVRRAPPESPIRFAPFLIVPTVVGVALMSFTRTLPPTDYLIETAPVTALLAAVVASRMCSGPAVSSRGMFPRTSSHLRLASVAFLGVALAFPFDLSNGKTDASGVKAPLPMTYCDNAAQWAELLDPPQTVFDLGGNCGLKLLDAGRAFEPPFTYPGNWFRPRTPWIGRSLSGDGSETAAVARLQTALSDSSDAGVIVANGLLLGEVDRRGWQEFFCEQWRLVWYRHVPGHRAGFDHLAVFVRAEIFERRPHPACVVDHGCLPASADPCGAHEG